MITKEQCAAARALLGVDKWTQVHLAKAAGLGESTVRNFEKGRAVPSDASLEAIAKALKAAGIDLVPENGGGAGVRLSIPGRAKPATKRMGRSR